MVFLRMRKNERLYKFMRMILGIKLAIKKELILKLR